MSEIRLSKMILHNFKGIKDFTLDINGSNTSVFGENGSGKTTLYDAFLWVLFDKDSTNRKDFSVKTHDSQGNEIHGLEHEVEAALSIDGKELKLRKILTEKWTKKRGEADKEFTGHETNYWVDDVPVKKNEYVTKINSLIDENIFKFLTNPAAFNQLNWQDRRKTLLEISGSVSDLDVIRSDTNLSKLEEILSGKSTDDYKKILAERIRKCNQDIEKIPVRIDEATKSIGEEQDYTAVEVELQAYKNQLVSIEQELTNASNSANVFHQKQQRLYKLQNDIEARKKAIEEQANSVFKKAVDEKTQLLNEKYKLSQEIGSFGSRLEVLAQSITDIGREVAQLRNQWQETNILTFVPPNEESFICPTCKQSLPVDNIQQKINDLKANFETAKAETLMKINTQGKALNAKKNSIESEANIINGKLFSLQAKLQEVTDRIAEIEKDLNNAGPIALDYNSDQQYVELKSLVNRLQAELDKPVENITEGLLAKKSTISTEIERLNRILNQEEVVIKTKERIRELKDEERKLAAQISELEGHRYLIEQFIKAKVNLLEDSINSRFKAVRFKLFDTQINGGVIECCETLVNTNGAWVPWSDANNAGRVNAGLDIINSLSRHYGVLAPIFLDNRESVNNLIETESQIINLVVSNDSKLRVEVV